MKDITIKTIINIIIRIITIMIRIPLAEGP